MRLDMTRVWKDATGMARANVDVLSGVAGMFILMPAIASGWFLPPRQPLPKGAAPIDVINSYSAYMTDNWLIMVASSLCIAFGTLALLALLLHRSRPTVTAALSLAAAALPIYAIANLIQSVMVMLGIIALILPGLYIAARCACIAPVALAEDARNPIHIVRRSFALTRGNGWRILLMLAIVFVVMTVLASAFVSLFGIVATVALPPDIGRLLMVVVGALFEAAMGVSIMLVSAAIYRQLTA